jgi:hypothetical protein
MPEEIFPTFTRWPFGYSEICFCPCRKSVTKDHHDLGLDLDGLAI